MLTDISKSINPNFVCQIIQPNPTPNIKHIPTAININFDLDQPFFKTILFQMGAITINWNNNERIKRIGKITSLKIPKANTVELSSIAGFLGYMSAQNTKYKNGIRSPAKTGKNILTAL
jgi:hypothetical protein